MSNPDPLHDEIKHLIRETLALDDIVASDIETDAPLFGDGLDLDSIDALELAMVLEEKYGVRLKDDPDENQVIFASVRSLATFVTENRVV